jgi:hypothetical protein
MTSYRPLSKTLEQALHRSRFLPLMKASLATLSRDNARD